MNAIDCDTGCPFTGTLPDPGAGWYPGEFTVKAYVPFGSEKVMLHVVEDSVVRPRVTFQVVPAGRPVWVNVTAYVTSVNGTARSTADPFTVRAPLPGTG